MVYVKIYTRRWQFGTYISHDMPDLYNICTFYKFDVCNLPCKEFFINQNDPFVCCYSDTDYKTMLTVVPLLCVPIT